MLLAVALALLLSANVGNDISRGLDSWAGRKSHLAVVNPVVPAAAKGDLISLRGEWEFSSFRHALEARDLRYHLDRNFWGRESQGWQNLRKIQVPGCWEAQGVGKEGAAHSYDNRECEQRLRHVHVGNGFYRKRVLIPAAWKGKRVWLKVGQAHTWAWAWINDKPVAHFCEGHRALKWDVTDLVTPGEECVIKFEVDNAYVGYRNTGTINYHRWGGLTRDVELEATPSAVWIDDAWVRGNFDTMSAEVHYTLGGDTNLARVVARIPKDLKPWSPEHPNLYTARVDLVALDGKILQTRHERFGIRKLEVRGKEFYLNGKPFFFRGFGDDHTYPITGNSPASKEYHLQHLRMARAAGFNFVRHHTHCEIPEFFEAADEAGIFVQPELSYNCDISSCETFAFDPVGDAEAIHEAYRRYPSFAVYSGGNEGTLGPAGKALFDWVHKNDPDRLVVEQDGGTYFEGHREDKSDYASGPMSMWERGCFNKRAFICHEYANIPVKGDARMEGDYTGVWLPRMTKEMRKANLRPAGLGEAWGNRLQDAQHDFQRMWALRSVECARKDPFCDGYIYWTIVDYTHFDQKMNAPNCQGLLDPFWREKPHGTTVKDMARVNSETAILLDTENRIRRYREDSDPMVCCGSLKKLVIEETNRVFAVGESIPAEFILAHYGERALENAMLKWSLVVPEKSLATGKTTLGTRKAGPAVTVAKEMITIPEVPRPVRATLKAQIVADDGVRAENSWNFWLFPRANKPEAPSGVEIVDYDSSELTTARKAGKNLLIIGNRKGTRDIYPGWWGTDWRDDVLTQNGVASLPHELWGEFPFEQYLSPLVFNILGQGTTLPVAGFEERDFVMVGEGNSDFKLYLAARTRPDGGREVFVSGLDLWSGRVEGNSLLKGIYNYLSKRGNASKARPEKSPRRTFCNPLPLPNLGRTVYRMGGLDHRQASDPALVRDGDKWRLFASAGFLWTSDDEGGSWRSAPNPQELYGHGPGATRHRGKWLYMPYTDGSIYRADRATGPYELLGKLKLPSGVPYFADAQLFSDDDGRLYFYWGCTERGGIWGAELDATNPLKFVTVPRELIPFDPEHQPWERCAAKPKNGWMEGAWMVKANGKYALIFAASGAEHPGYAMGAYWSDKPLGAFKPQRNNPFFKSSTGFITGTGHGSVAQDERGDWYVTYCITIGEMHQFQRLVGMDRLELDANGEFVPRSASCEPQWLGATGKRGTAWSKLKVKTSATAAADDSLATFTWLLDKDSTIEYELEAPSRVNSFRLVWREGGYQPDQGVKGGPIGYRVELRGTNGSWRVVFDSHAAEDLMTDYREIPETIATAARLVPYSRPSGLTLGLYDWSLFGVDAARLPIFRGFEAARYQQHDELIIKLVDEFNADKAKACGGTQSQADKIDDLDPSVIKAMMIEESGGNSAQSLAAWAVDPLQVNVPGDWGDEKLKLGLVKPTSRNEGTLEQNLRAGICYLSRKGFSVSGRPAADRVKGYFDDWPTAVRRYNGWRNDYAHNIMTRATHPELNVPIGSSAAKKHEQGVLAQFRKIWHNIVNQLGKNK